MRPSSVPQVVGEKNVFLAGIDRQHVKLASVDCPDGTVPIRRVTKEDLVRFKLHEEKINSNYDDPGSRVAVLLTKHDRDTVYYGAGATMSVYAPTVLSSQFSSGRMAVLKGNEHIRFGWMVNQALYGNNIPHFFTHLKAGDSICYNLRCPGFVQVDRFHPVDAIIDDVSVSGGDIHDFKFVIYRGEATSKWWLKFRDNVIGFWPVNIFPSLKENANLIEWGGAVYSPTDFPSPPMGSGSESASDPATDAYFGDIRVVDGDNHLVKITDYELYIEDAKDDRYKANFKENYNKDLQDVMFFGGPGGITG